MNTEINIDDYVSEEEKKELCIEYIRQTLRGDGNENHKERVLSNMAYTAAHSLIDESLSQEDIEIIKLKTKEIILNSSNYGVFRKKDAWGSEDSVAWIEVKKAIEENKYLINDLVKKAILSRDYEKDLNGYENYFIETIMAIFKKGLEAK
jgi:hypothetical protein